jgi:hypothetical protein
MDSAPSTWPVRRTVARAEQKPESGCGRDSDVAMDVRLGSAIREGGYTVAVGLVAELLN